MHPSQCTPPPPPPPNSPLLVQRSQHAHGHRRLWAGGCLEAVPLCGLVDEHPLELACGRRRDLRRVGGRGCGCCACDECLELFCEYEQEHSVFGLESVFELFFAVEEAESDVGRAGGRGGGGGRRRREAAMHGQRGGGRGDAPVGHGGGGEGLRGGEGGRGGTRHRGGREQRNEE